MAVKTFSCLKAPKVSAVFEKCQCMTNRCPSLVFYIDGVTTRRLADF